MRVRAVVGSAALCSAFAIAIVSCIDLFHSTGDFKNLCELDASACVADATAGDAEPGFCSWSSGAAMSHAQHACAWLGGCELPVGGNQLGSCMFHALVAYDCSINPNERPRGNADAFWQCMANANTCDEVRTCVFPGTDGGFFCASLDASSDFTQCPTSTGNSNSRLECIPQSQLTAASPLFLANGSFAAGENCAAWGQTCAAADDGGGPGACRGDTNGFACTASECVGANLVICDDAGNNIGIDCTNTGAGACINLACAPNVTGPDAGTACAVSGTVTCVDGGVAQICRGINGGSLEQVNCTALTGPNSCNAINGEWNLPSACHADSGCVDSCNGSVATSCYAGANFTVDCAAAGFHNCTLTQTIDDLADASRAMCL